MHNTLTITYHGHSAFQIDWQEWSILIDPFITGNPQATVAAEALQPSHIIVTHGHGDHLGDTIEIAKRTGAQVITTYEVANYVKGKGAEDVVDLGVGGGRDVPFGRVTFTIAHHGSSAPDGTYMGAAAGVIIEIGEMEIYHAGDTALTYDMKLLAELHDIRLAMLPIGDNYTMGIRQAIKAVEFIDPDIVVPMHFNTFEPITVDPEEFRAGVEPLGVEVIIPSPGESFQLSARS